MAATTAHTKQTLQHPPALIALADALHILPHHTKAFRKRHLLFLILTLAFVGTMALELGAVITRQSLDPRTLFNQAVTDPAVRRTTLVRSSSGFAFGFNNEQFSVQARGDGATGGISDSDLKSGKALTSVVLSPLPSRVPAPEAAAELELASETDAGAFATFKTKAPTGQDMPTVTANYFAPKPTTIADIALESRTADTLNGTAMVKSVYKISPKFAGNPTHTIVWTAQVNGKPLSVTVRGIVVGAEIPSSMAPIFQTLKISSDAKVEGLSTLFGEDKAPILDQKYVADLVSPAVIKVYHIVCGTLVYKGSVVATDTCEGLSGSGFIVSQDGYIGTNGHVVVYGAKDMLSSALLKNPTLLAAFLKGTKLTDTQVQEVMGRPDLTASVVSKIYDLSDAELRLQDQHDLTVVALGSTPLELKDEQDARRMVGAFRDTESLKSARIVGYNYSPKDQLTVVSDPKKGFSASDVALLKIEAKNLPVVQLADGPVTQNEKISLFGFPGDADNALTDNSKLSVTVTNGAISSIRDTAGTASKLYQSDADASAGNSGGPAINEDGQVFGLLTYRFSSGESTDAAKSYIRDIKDFKDLMKNKDITPNPSSPTQAAWQKGLDLYSKHHYSAAQTQFEKVKELFPSHRLADQYIELSEQAISEGKDVKDPSILLLLLGVGAGIGGIGLAVVLIARHHGKHQVYKAFRRHGLAHAH